MSDNEQTRTPALGRGRGAAGGISLGLPRGRNVGSGGGSERREGDHQLSASSSSSSSSSSSYANTRIADTAIRLTDNDAVGSRIAAIQHHYLDADRYTHLLGPTNPPAPRPPIINIGTYLRCRAIDSLVADFLDQGPEQKQIVSLGAGSDSRYWRLRDDARTKERIRHYVELDFAELTLSKVEKIVRHKELLNLISPEQSDVHIREKVRHGLHRRVSKH
jgi:[phosphatase 2A protein]-leucine-carboxy methyltransferase